MGGRAEATPSLRSGARLAGTQNGGLAALGMGAADGTGREIAYPDASFETAGSTRGREVALVAAAEGAYSADSSTFATSGNAVGRTASGLLACIEVN